MSHSLSFLHAADLHLDSPFKGLQDVPEKIFSEIRQSTFHSFDNLINTALKKQVDFILLVGDLFDSEKQSLKAQMHLKKGFEQLNLAGIAVYLSYGNHDFIKGNLHPIDYPDNVHIFPGEHVSNFMFKKHGDTLAHIYGFSYENRAVTNNKALEFKITGNLVPFHIAMLHGSLHGNQHHDPYAPFRLQDLHKEAFDYWALGHIHQRGTIQANPPVVYPGNIQGRHRLETGAKGCYHVILNKGKISLEFIPLQHILFEKITIDTQAAQSITDIEIAIKEKMQKQKESASLVSLHLKLTTEQIGKLDNRIEDLIEILNDHFIENEIWQYIYHYQLEDDASEKIVADPFFLDEMTEALQEIDFHSEMNMLFRHPEAKRHLEQLSEEEIRKEAEKLLRKKLPTIGR